MFPTQITLRNLPHSPELSARVRDVCEKLAYLHPGIQRCRVSIEQALVSSRCREHPRGLFTIEVEVRLPDVQLGRQPQSDPEIEVALRKAFTHVRRQLREAHKLEREALRQARSRDSDRGAPAPGQPAY
jgi:hypothetical protein